METICKDCIKFKRFEYKTHGYCSHGSPKQPNRLVVRSNQPTCKYFSEAGSMLDLLKLEVHKKGFNISMMINLFKKKQRDRKALYDVPDEVLCAVCSYYLLKHDTISHDFPYFLRVLEAKSQDYRANQTRKEAKDNKFGEMAESVKSIMKRAF